MKLYENYIPTLKQTIFSASFLSEHSLPCVYQYVLKSYSKLRRLTQKLKLLNKTGLLCNNGKTIRQRFKWWVSKTWQKRENIKRKKMMEINIVGHWLGHIAKHLTESMSLRTIRVHTSLKSTSNNAEGYIVMWPMYFLSMGNRQHAYGS